MQEVIRRKDAKARGMKWYFTGKPCKNGHISDRQTVNGACRQCAGEACLRYYTRNADEIRARARRNGAEYASNNRGRINAYLRQRYHESEEFYSTEVARRILKRTLGMTEKSKSDTTERLLGYTFQELREHIERQFAKGMGWHNRSEWHIDHITPIIWFIRNGITDPAKINCLSNLQPVWADVNQRKGDRLETLL